LRIERQKEIVDSGAQRANKKIVDVHFGGGGTKSHKALYILEELGSYCKSNQKLLKNYKQSVTWSQLGFRKFILRTEWRIGWRQMMTCVR
jgi:hypothetical protein